VVIVILQFQVKHYSLIYKPSGFSQYSLRSHSPLRGFYLRKIRFCARLIAACLIAFFWYKFSSTPLTFYGRRFISKGVKPNIRTTGFMAVNTVYCYRIAGCTHNHLPSGFNFRVLIRAVNTR